MDMADRDSLHDQQQYPIPSRGSVPMEELEARASRFVSHLVGDMENAKPLPSSSKAHLSLPALQRRVVEGRLRQLEDKLYPQMEI